MRASPLCRPRLTWESSRACHAHRDSDTHCHVDRGVRKSRSASTDSGTAAANRRVRACDRSGSTDNGARRQADRGSRPEASRETS